MKNRVIKVCEGLMIEAKENDLRTSDQIIKDWKRSRSNSKILHKIKMKNLQFCK